MASVEWKMKTADKGVKVEECRRNAKNWWHQVRTRGKGLHTALKEGRRVGPMEQKNERMGQRSGKLTARAWER